MSNHTIIEGEVLHGNLPYRFVPEENDNNITTNNDNIINKIMNYPNYNKVNRKQITTFIIVWTLVAAFLSTASSVLFHAGIFSLIIGNIFTGALIRGAMSYKSYIRIPCYTIAALWIFFAQTGLNSVVMFATLICAIYFSRRKIGSYNFGNSYGEHNAPLASITDSMVSVWGIAGAHVAAGDYEEAGEIGAKGEAIIGEKLDKLARDFPFVRVFNGVRFTPGKDGADVDHVVLIGNKIYFVDAKFWSIMSYNWMLDGTIHRNGGPFKGGNIHMDAAMQKWYPLVSEYGTIHTRITLCIPERRNTYNIDNRNAPHNIYMVTLNELMNELYHVAEKETDPYVDRRLVHIVANELQK